MNSFPPYYTDASFCEGPLSDLIRNLLTKPTSKTKQLQLPKITALRKALFDSLKQIELLENHAKEASTSVDWPSTYKILEAERSSLEARLNSFSPSCIQEAQKVIHKRAQKRSREKRRRAKLRAQNELVKAQRLRRHAEIDEWQNNMKNTVEDLKREDNLKSQADLVLGSVKTKISEAKKMLSLLNGLAKLRQIRSRNIQGASESEGFSQVIEKLKDHWTQQIKEYRTEERGLNVMLEQSQHKSGQTQSRAKKRVKLLGHLFGEATLPDLPLTSLISIRNEWDAFSVDSHIMTSSIPFGWVLPPPPADDEWAKLLKD